MKELLTTADSIVNKVTSVLSAPLGWIASFFVFLTTFFGDRITLFYYLIGAVAIDLVWGIISAIKRKKFILSSCLAKSAVKVAIYASIYFIVAFVEKGLGDFYIGTRIVTAVLCAGELWSVLGHILIISPNFPVVRILKKVLLGEMSKKTGLSEEELNNYLEGKNNEKTTTEDK